MAAARRWPAYVLFVAVFALAPGRAAAEKVLTKIDNWEVFSDGRAGGFVSWVYGDGHPGPVQAVDPAEATIGMSQPGRVASGQTTARAGSQQPERPGDGQRVRLRTGFIGNLFGFGVRGQLTEWTKLSAYVQIWMFVENDNRQKNTGTSRTRDKGGPSSKGHGEASPPAACGRSSPEERRTST